MQVGRFKGLPLFNRSCHLIMWGVFGVVFLFFFFFGGGSHFFKNNNNNIYYMLILYLRLPFFLNNKLYAHLVLCYTVPNKIIKTYTYCLLVCIPFYPRIFIV